MGFHRRYITKEMILKAKHEDLVKLFNADAFVFDIWSGKFYEEYKKGLTKDKILKIMSE